MEGEEVVTERERERGRGREIITKGRRERK